MPAMGSVAMLVMVAVVGGRGPWCRLWRWYRRWIRRGLLADGERGRRRALLLLDAIELVDGGGNELLDGGDVVVTIRVLALDRAELGAQGVQGILAGLRGGGARGRVTTRRLSSRTSRSSAAQAAQPVMCPSMRWRSSAASMPSAYGISQSRAVA